jgi:hypothetical protein
MVPQVPSEGAGVDIADADHSVELEIVVERTVGLPVANDRAVLADDEAGGVYAPGLEVLGIHPVVADLRIGHRHQLKVIGRVRQNLLVAAHGGVKDHLPEGRPGLAEGQAIVVGAVG